MRLRTHPRTLSPAPPPPLPSSPLSPQSPNSSQNTVSGATTSAAVLATVPAVSELIPEHCLRRHHLRCRPRHCSRSLRTHPRTLSPAPPPPLPSSPLSPQSPNSSQNTVSGATTSAAVLATVPAVSELIPEHCLRRHHLRCRPRHCPRSLRTHPRTLSPAPQPPLPSSPLSPQSPNSSQNTVSGATTSAAVLATVPAVSELIPEHCLRRHHLRCRPRHCPRSLRTHPRTLSPAPPPPLPSSPLSPQSPPPLPPPRPPQLLLQLPTSVEGGSRESTHEIVVYSRITSTHYLQQQSMCSSVSVAV
ncbi:uncharacterized protein LOC126282357 [Schistocerca gregaria]|uniref:uncharacterized protein LOC126282357 n=1 Tax=Schistocerca gregaria TaxID=7010 RepID=UPI00211E9041|nr:uncharacterized protein LOC126282357 [Schistocerca gregaria]